MSEAIKIKKTTLYFALTIIIIIGAGYFLLGEKTTQNNVLPDTSDGEFQKVVIGMKNFNYYPNTVTVQSGKPVRIYLDETAVGCFRSFMIRDFGVAKYLKTPNDYVEFTPNKKGTFSFACSMGMGTGTLVVQ